MAVSGVSVDGFIDRGLRERMMVFLDDLQKFNEATLLENYTDSTFMSSTYFTEDEKDRLLSLAIRGRTLKETLDELFEKRALCDGEVCASHHLKPIYERFFGFRKSDMKENKLKRARETWCNWRRSSSVVVPDASTQS